MARIHAVLSLLLLLMAPQAVWADARELSVAQSIVIDAPVDKVWEIVGDFGGLSRWLPPILESRIVLGKNREAGGVRSARDGVPEGVDSPAC